MVFLQSVLGIAVSFGPVLIWLILLNRRDRRTARLHLSVCELVASPELRGRLAVQVRCATFSPSCTVIVDILARTYHEVWHIFAQMSRHLPPGVRFVVHAAVGHQFVGRLTLETFTRGSPSGPPCASLITD